MTSASDSPPVASESSSEENEGEHIMDGICTECYSMGRSKIDKRSIAGFGDIIVRAFECEDCGRRTEEVQLAGQHAEQGVRLSLAVPQGCAVTLGRAVLKSDTATISIPELEFEIGAGSCVPFAGDLTTVADVLMQACKNLNMNQAERREADVETASKIDDFIQELEGYAAGQHAFTFVVEDVAGNSFIAGPQGGTANADDDAQLTVERFPRTPAQDSRMGLDITQEFLLDEQQQEAAAAAADEAAAVPASAPGRLILRVEGQQEVRAFLGSYSEAAVLPPHPAVQPPTCCPACGNSSKAGFAAAVHRPVPGFIRDCILISASCASCSATSAEVRGTGGVSAQGSRLRLRVSTPADLQRAVLQSASASIAVPELELALSTGSSAGMATTVGQLITNLAQQLGGNPALQPGGGGGQAGSDVAPGGDQAAADVATGLEAEQAEWRTFLADLRAFASLEREWTLELTDPLDSSFLAAANPAEVGDAAEAGVEDSRVSIIRYDRSPDENEHFGLARGGGAAPIA